jgi:hypothetical protein
MAEPQDQHEEEGPMAPAQLVEAMKALHKERIFVPPAVDEAVLREARQHLSQTEPRQFGWRPWVSWAAMAACLALIAWLVQRPDAGPDGGRFAPEDINHDGRVDILDAFALARKIETAGTLEPRWDINGDGRINRADVSAIADRAVTLTQTSLPTKRADTGDHRRIGLGSLTETVSVSVKTGGNRL